MSPYTFGLIKYSESNYYVRKIVFLANLISINFSLFTGTIRNETGQFIYYRRVRQAN